jgi:hypothetical protein
VWCGGCIRTLQKLLPLSHRNTMQGSRVLYCLGQTAPGPGRDRRSAQTSANINTVLRNEHVM